MRIVLAIFTVLALFAVSQSAQAADFGAPAKNLGQGTLTDLRTQMLGSAMTGGQTATGSVRGLARKRCLALLALVGRHLDTRLHTDRAQALYLSGETDPQNNSAGHTLAKLSNHLLGVDAAFALGGANSKVKRPAYAVLSANPKRIKLTLKYRW